jgi:uncharacterized lipoprotein
MIKQITAGLLAVTLLASCETTKTTQRTTLREMNSTRLAAADTNLNDPAPPAEGPEDIPAEGPRDPVRNPALVPTPLLRDNAASRP